MKAAQCSTCPVVHAADIAQRERASALGVHRSDVAALTGKYDALVIMCESAARNPSHRPFVRNRQREIAKVLRQVVADLEALPRVPVETLHLAKP